MRTSREDISSVHKTCEDEEEFSSFLKRRGLGPARNKAPRSLSLTPPRWDGEEKIQ